MEAPWLSRCTYKNLLRRLLSRSYISSFQTCSFFYLPSNDMLKQSQTPYHLSTLPLVFVNEAPHGLIAKRNSNESQGLEATHLKILHSCLISRYLYFVWGGGVGAWSYLCIWTMPRPLPTRLGTISVDGVKAMSSKWTFRLNMDRLKKGGKGSHFSKWKLLWPTLKFNSR